MYRTPSPERDRTKPIPPRRAPKPSHPLPNIHLPHPLDRTTSEKPDALTYVEQYQRRFSASFRSNRDWTDKLDNRADFVELLRKAEKEDRNIREEKVLTWRKEDINMVYYDLVKRYKPYVMSLRAEESFIEPDIDCVWREDGFLDNDGLRSKLTSAIHTLENGFLSKDEWRLTSEDQTVDLINPYCWPIVYGRSVLNNGNTAEVSKNSYHVRSSYEANYRQTDKYSKSFCWLPSEFDVSPDGKSTNIASYINNLALMRHERVFYPILENIFTFFVPMFDRTIADIAGGKHKCRRVRSPSSKPERWVLSAKKHKRRWERLLKQFENGEKLQEDFDSDSSEGEIEDESKDPGGSKTPPPQTIRKRNFDVRELALYRRKWDRQWEPPTPSEGTSLRGQTAKVIVRLMNVTLSPQNPKFVTRGGWTIEGVLVRYSIQIRFLMWHVMRLS
ncbi:hypothetical protein TWF481_006823 [Arthrobotrys musiformis]|uniref:DUF4246 domain-containing protein n=1 Tax=Arthrobotrys musiformis TaxID=47236 RepID=A0AAV9WBB0_9PEZI